MTLRNGNEHYREVSPDEFRNECVSLWKKNCLPRLLFATDERETGQGFCLYAVFSSPGEDRFEIPFMKLAEGTFSFQSLTVDIPAFHWYEREIRDMFGLVPEGHPDERQLVLHDCYPKDIFPLRRDVTVEAIKERTDDQRIDRYPYIKVDGEAIYEIPVGPVHAGIIEPGHFRFSAVGETVYYLDPRLFYVHKGVEKHFESAGFNKGVALAERISGVSTIGHGVAYCRAVERMAGVSIPQKAVAGRTILLELERLYNHVGDIANMCAGTGFAVGYARGTSLREELQALNGRVTGSRFLRGALQLGGLSRDVLEHAQHILDTVLSVHDKFIKYKKFLFSDVGHMERLDNTGILPEEIARNLGATGPAARASGIQDDIRTSHPYLAYKRHAPEPFAELTGDALARLNVRAREIDYSVSVIQSLLSRPVTGGISADIPEIAAGSHALGYTEGPRGSIFYFVKASENGRPLRVKVRSASYCNWPVISFAVKGNIVPDFPLINKSFNLSYSGCDM
ncbi:MAG: hypothetical protein AMK71_08125 [Nitrospira bacterium SG8_35_4]|nr:MAG: hypothetical protein AMK71_08125 [Nitrospira bacterium SG8_35_4]